MSDFLSRLRALYGAASKAPWSDDASDPSDVVVWGERKNDDERLLMNVGGANPSMVGVAFDIDAANAALIVALRNRAARIAALVEAVGAYRDATDAREGHRHDEDRTDEERAAFARLCAAESRAYREMIAALVALDAKVPS